MELVCPGKDLLETENYENQKNLYKIFEGLIDSHKTTLIFTNTINATEKIIHYLDSYFLGKYNEVKLRIGSEMEN